MIASITFMVSMECISFSRYKLHIQQSSLDITHSSYFLFTITEYYFIKNRNRPQTLHNPFYLGFPWNIFRFARHECGLAFNRVHSCPLLRRCLDVEKVSAGGLFARKKNAEILEKMARVISVHLRHFVQSRSRDAVAGKRLLVSHTRSLEQTSRALLAM